MPRKLPERTSDEEGYRRSAIPETVLETPGGQGWALCVGIQVGAPNGDLSTPLQFFAGRVPH